MGITTGISLVHTVYEVFIFHVQIEVEVSEKNLCEFDKSNPKISEKINF